MIVIATLFHNSTWMLTDYLATLTRLAYPTDELALYWLDDGSQDGTHACLLDAADALRARYAQMTVAHVPGTRRNLSSRDAGGSRRSLYAHLAALRQQVLEHTRAFDAEALLVMDHDTLPAPSLLTDLLAHGAPAVGTLQLCDCHLRNDLGVAPLALGRRINAGYLRGGDVQWLRWYDASGQTVPVDVIGGCYLLRRQVVAAIDYPHTVHPRGEDVGYFAAVHAAGLPVVLDTRVQSIHVMLPRLLPAARQAWSTLFHVEYPSSVIGEVVV